MRIVRTVPLPRGGCTLMLFTSCGIGVQLGIGHAAHHHRQRGSDQARQAGGELFLVERLGHVEVDARVVGRDRAAIDRLRAPGGTAGARRCESASAAGGARRRCGL
jgi:hypothetical protein